MRAAASLQCFNSAAFSSHSSPAPAWNFSMTAVLQDKPAIAWPLLSLQPSSGLIGSSRGHSMDIWSGPLHRLHGNVCCTVLYSQAVGAISAHCLRHLLPSPPALNLGAHRTVSLTLPPTLLFLTHC